MVLTPRIWADHAPSTGRPWERGTEGTLAYGFQQIFPCQRGQWGEISIIGLRSFIQGYKAMPNVTSGSLHAPPAREPNVHNSPADTGFYRQVLEWMIEILQGPLHVAPKHQP